MKRQLRLTIKIILLMVVIAMLASGGIAFFLKYSKSHFGGIVVNKSDHPIRILEDGYVRTINPGETSRDKDIFDVDFIIIDRPARFENKLYTSGMLKICDYGKIEILNPEQNRDLYNSSGGMLICKLLNDLKWQENNSLKTAR